MRRTSSWDGQRAWNGNVLNKLGHSNFQCPRTIWTLSGEIWVKACATSFVSSGESASMNMK